MVVFDLKKITALAVEAQEIQLKKLFAILRLEILSITYYQ
jgi:hypothetical protein